MKRCINVDISLDEFWILNDVLYEIQESREYEGDDLIVLDRLKEKFCFSKYTEFEKRLKEE